MSTFCFCEHASTQHFDHGDKPCAHCTCKKFRPKRDPLDAIRAEARVAGEKAGREAAESELRRLLYEFGFTNHGEPAHEWLRLRLEKRAEARAQALEEAARIVAGWHIRKGGYTEMAHTILALAHSTEPAPKVKPHRCHAECYPYGWHPCPVGETKEKP